MEKKAIIVGQGLAGTVLAENLLERGYHVYIFDENKNHNASGVAAGVYNPIIAKRLTTTWMAESLVEKCIQFYSDFGKKVGKSIMRTIPVYIIFDSIAQQNDWASKSKEVKFNSWVQPDLEVSQNIHQAYGGQWFQGSGAVNTNEFLNAFSEQTNSNIQYISEKFIAGHIIEKEDKVIYEEIEADYIFFCEGAQATNNIYFSNIPFSPAKGEVLTIKVPGLNVSHIVQSGVYILPMGDDVYIVGATYEWKELNELTTETGKEELIGKIKKVISLPFEIMEHKASIRPAIKDRRPVIGMHPNHPRIGIFNGLGTKGVLLAPWFAEHFVNHMEDNTPLMPEINVLRYFKTS